MIDVAIAVYLNPSSRDKMLALKNEKAQLKEEEKPTVTTSKTTNWADVLSLARLEALLFFLSDDLAEPPR